MALSYFVNFWHQNARIIYRHFNKIAKIPVLNFSKSRNKIVEPQIFPKNKWTNLFIYSDCFRIEKQIFCLFFGRICGSTILFWDLLTFTSNYVFFLFWKQLLITTYILVKRFPYFFPLTVTYWSFLSAVLAF